MVLYLTRTKDEAKETVVCLSRKVACLSLQGSHGGRFPFSTAVCVLIIHSGTNLSKNLEIELCGFLSPRCGAEGFQKIRNARLQQEAGDHAAVSAVPMTAPQGWRGWG